MSTYKKISRVVLDIRLILLFSGYVFGSEIEVESKITKVMVYPDSALVSRTAVLKLNPGRYRIIFPNIIPEIDENSLMVKSDGTAEVKLLGAQLKRKFLEEVPSERIKQLKEEIQRLEDEIKKLENFKKILSEKKSFLDSIRIFSKEQIPKDLVTKMPTVKDLEDILKFLDIKLKENYSQLLDTEVKIRDLANKVDTLKKELASISGPVKKLKREWTY